MGATTGAENHSPVISYRAAEWGGISLAHWRVKPGELSERTYADHEINIPLSGRFTSVRHNPVGRRRHGYGDAKTICIVPAGQPVAARWREESECDTLFLKPALVERAAAGDPSAARVEIVETYEAADQLVRQIGLTLLAEVESDAPLGRLYAESLAQALALHLVRCYSASRPEPGVFRGGLSGGRLRRVREFINECLEQDLTLADIAESAGLSQFHFARAFKQTTGLTPQQYVTERRVERAKFLLTESELPLVE